ncbi:7TM diverse intracellular signaling domain-containing protein [Rhodonellum sp.]|uniref:7TM diverse intracellular signaling domain-containing protein n=1 Tax=Rhodonellum sp. TaxID=2231180 RepID=UPI002718810B|nr:7TM diverse intracellular signaling domain-containing protein [Rhodonellum sp.]MDO9551880.1 7TM diverse intracellular signaling domain-containing protein [Rhodonellum sp.]
MSGDAFLKIDDRLEERILDISQLQFYEDKENILDFEDILKGSFQENFTVKPEFSKNNFNTSHTYWIRFALEKNPGSLKNWILEFYDQTIDEIEIYVPRQDGTYEKVLMGYSLPFAERTFRHKNFELELENQSKGIDQYYIKIRSSQKADIRIAVRSMNRFIFYALNEYFLYGIFYGMIAIIALYNTLVYFAVKEIKYLYYTFYLLSVAIYAMCVDGISFQYLWPKNPEYNQIAKGITSYFVVAWAILFSIRFLNTKVRSQRIHKTLWVILGIKTILFLIGLFWNNKLFEIKYYDVIPTFFIFFSSIYIWTKGYQVVRFFVIAYGVLFIGLMIKVLANTGIIPHNTIIYYSLHFAFLLEMLLLTFALGDRIRILKKNRDRAFQRTIKQIEINYGLKEKVNLELENKVKERTQELESKSAMMESINRQLIEKDEEIKRINSFLDKDNWKLKSSIKQSFQDRLTNKLLSYEEFKKIFPDQSACYRYLEEFKWSKGFECKSCGNHKSSTGPKLFTKRCSKCGYIESATVGTVFHGVKFPLEKGFYIAYTVISETEKQTLEKLSEMLDLRKNTVGSFRKRVKDILDSNGHSNPQWEDIMGETNFQKTAL